MHAESDAHLSLTLKIGGMKKEDSGRYTCELFIDGQQSVHPVYIYVLGITTVSAKSAIKSASVSIINFNF